MSREQERNADYEELKRQLNVLRDRIEKNADISDRMIRKAIGRNMDHLYRMGIIALIVCIAALIFVELILIGMGVSRLFLVVTFIFLSVNAYFAFRLRIRKISFSPESSLMETAKRVVKYKKDNELSLMIGLPLAFVWCIWCVREIGIASGMDDIKQFGLLACSALVGFLIGGFIGYFSMFRPAMREADEILDQIDELHETE